MISSILQSQDNGPSADANDLRQVFVGRVHQVLQEGYARLDAPSYQETPEPAITGELVRSMNSFLRGMSAPAWADHFSIHDDPPVNDGNRFGKDRHRIDIRVDASTPRPGASFAFEAKRLARGYTVSRYLGEAGLGCILCGDYAKDDDDAGMVGYMQDNDADYWASQIEGAIEADLAAYEASGPDWWQPQQFHLGPRHVFASTHARSAVGRPVVVYHSLLLFRSISA